MTRTGWGIRALQDSELCSSFELPDYVLWNDRFLRDLVPLQMCRAVIDSVIDSKIHSPAPSKRSSVSVERTAHPPSRTSSQDVIWLPSVSRWLPGSWADIEIADKAVKSDNAPVDFRPWHRRIQSLFPCTLDTLCILERVSVRRWRANVCRSFCAYLSSAYGDRWRDLDGLSFLKRQITDPPAPARKRRSVDSVGTIASGSVGGVKKGSGEGFVDAFGELDEGDSLKNKLKSNTELLMDSQKGLLVLGQIMQSTWWEWTSGSSLLFWRWNGPEQIVSARDGMHIFVKSAFPRSRHQTRPPRFDIDTRKLVARKIETMVSKTYLEEGYVRSSLHYFSVPKGDDDIRVVFDGTSCGLNESLWSPNFFLPTSRNASELLSFDTWMADVDFGEFFHNFFADDRIRKHAGVDVSPLNPCFPHSRTGDKLKFMGLRWSRLFMGMKPSPYNAVRFYYWAEEFARGNLRDPSNPFGFDKVVLNLPGMESYDSTKPKLSKWNSSRDRMAGDVVTFVDDVRITGSLREHCHEVNRQFTSRIQYLGIQDAPRKFRPPSQDQAGAWTGTIFKITGTTITKSVSQEKWMKGKTITQGLLRLLDSHPSERPLLNRKDLERQTGFLNHLTMTFDEMTPYLKGFYLTLNSWRPKRDRDDWKMSDKTWIQCLVAQCDNGSITERELENELNHQSDTAAPDEVTASTRLGDDVRALSSMFASDTPPQLNLRSRRIVTVIYGFGDASGTGLGATFTCGTGFTFRIGVWSSDDSGQSSNWREFTNIVDSLEDEAKSGNLEGAEVFMFTDNSTVESCAIKGSSSSPKLFHLVVRLRALVTVYSIKVHIFHVSGTRMIAQGTDGVSRGFLGEGVMSGESMISFIPLHMSATDRSPTLLLEWVRSWAGSDLIELNPIDWFDVGHDFNGWKKSWDGFDRPRLAEARTYLWSPAPFVADIAISELRKARIKRQSSSHVVIVPKLCTPMWIKQLFKAADIVFEIPAGQLFWDCSMHEPLLIAILFPFIRCKPWQLRSTPKMYAMSSELRKVLRAEEMDPGHILREFWDQCHRLRFMPANVVRKMLYFRNGE